MEINQIIPKRITEPVINEAIDFKSDLFLFIFRMVTPRASKKYCGFFKDSILRANASCDALNLYRV